MKEKVKDTKAKKPQQSIDKGQSSQKKEVSKENLQKIRGGEGGGGGRHAAW